MCFTKDITTVFIFVHCCCCCVDIVVTYHLNLRHRRDTDEVTGIGIPSDEDPQPFHSLGSDSLAPWFPLTHSYADGMSINKGDNTELHGHLNVPMTNWNTLWDMKSHFKSGPDNTWWNYGHLLSPANPLKFSRATVAAISTSPKIAATRNKAESVPVIHLPTDYVPVKCKPPMCNPFIHTFDTGFNIQPAAFDIVPLAASLDFPVRMPDGTYRRFPISGDLDLGQVSSSVVYGHMLSNVDPFKGQQANPRSILPAGLQPEPSRSYLSDTPSPQNGRLDSQRQQMKSSSRSQNIPSDTQTQDDAPLVSARQDRAHPNTRDPRRNPPTTTIMPKFIWPRRA